MHGTAPRPFLHLVSLLGSHRCRPRSERATAVRTRFTSWPSRIDTTSPEVSLCSNSVARADLIASQREPVLRTAIRRAAPSSLTALILAFVSHLSGCADSSVHPGDIFVPPDDPGETPLVVTECSPEVGCVPCGALRAQCPTGFVCDEASATGTEFGAFCLSQDGAEVYIPGGRFWMGCNPALDAGCQDNETPQHLVELPPYTIDRIGAQSNGEPIVNVKWAEAKANCASRGKRLCTEAEWERAARGGCETVAAADCRTTMRTYPWGEEDPTCTLAPVQGCPSFSQAGARPAGASPYGVLDMASTLSEWMADGYAPDFYCNGPDATFLLPYASCEGAAPYEDVWRSPKAPDAQHRVIRNGRGSYFEAASSWKDFRSARRFGFDSEYGAHSVSFRCCRSL